MTLLRALSEKLTTINFYRLIHAILPWRAYLKIVAKSLKPTGNTAAEQVIICIGRTPFDKDFEQLSYRVRSYSWVWLDNNALNIYQRHTLPASCQKQTFYENTLESCKPEWDRCQKKTNYLLKQIAKRFKIKTFVTANIDYWQDWAIKNYCHENCIPFTVLAKEFPINEAVKNQYKERYHNYRATTDAIAVFGQSLKELYSYLNVAPDTSIYVTGAPRIDRWKAVEPAPKQNTLTLLSFRSGYGADSEAEFFSLLEKIASSLHETGFSNLVIKSKNRIDTKTIRSYCDKHNLSSITIRHDLPLYDIVPSSKAVIGFNSLAVIESMLSNTEILVPNWIGMHDEEKMLDPKQKHVTEAVQFCDSVDEMIASLKQANKNEQGVSEDIMKQRERTQNDFWDHSPDTSASEKFRKVIEEIDLTK